MMRPAFVQLLVVLLVGITACSARSTSAPTFMPTVDRVATSVSETLTAQAEATAVAATVAARTQPKPNIDPSPIPLPVTLPPLGASPVIPPSVVVPPVVPPLSVYYNLIMRYSKNCLSVRDGLAFETTCSQSTQLWNLPTDATTANFQVQLQNTGKCLSASSTTPAEPFVLKSCRGDSTQLWQKRPSGGYFQLANNTQLAAAPTTNMCVDARQWAQPIIQWFCKPWGDDNQLDNQLFCQATGNTATCTPPAGVYVTNIQQTPPPYAIDGKPNTFLVYFNVTFSNTTGSEQPYRWFVQIYGQGAGQTTEQVLPIPPGTTTISVGPWNIGRTCTDFTAKGVWRRGDGLLFAFKGPDGGEYTLPFKIRTAC